MSVKISPNARRQFVNSSGTPYVGAKLFYYVAGSTTKQNTYTTSTGAIANTNPIILDSDGRTPYAVWFTAGATYKEVLAPSTDTDPPTSTIYTEDNLSGVNDIAAAPSNQWVASSFAPTYVSATQFTVPGDQSTEMHVGRRLQLTTSAGTVYGRISVSAYTSITTVTMVMDSVQVLDSGLSSFNLSVLSATNHAIPRVSDIALTSLGVATLASPALTGTPTAPTAAAGTDTTQLATTAFIASVLQTIYPVGVIYSSTASANPNSILGFGTWAAFGAGRVPVGFSGAGLYTAGATGGSADAINVSHSHTGTVASAGAHTHTINEGTVFPSGAPANLTSGDDYTGAAAYSQTTSSDGAHSHSLTVDAAGASGTNANLPPYIVVYMWNRTA